MSSFRTSTGPRFQDHNILSVSSSILESRKYVQTAFAGSRTWFRERSMANAGLSPSGKPILFAHRRPSRISTALRPKFQPFEHPHAAANSRLLRIGFIAPGQPTSVNIKECFYPGAKERRIKYLHVDGTTVITRDRLVQFIYFSLPWLPFEWGSWVYLANLELGQPSPIFLDSPYLRITR